MKLNPHLKVEENTKVKNRVIAKVVNAGKEYKTLQYTKDAFIANLKIDNIKSKLKTQQENIVLGIESIRILQDRVNEGQESASNLNVEEANLQVLEADLEITKKQLGVYWLDNIKSSGQLSLLWK